jgi:hypothetical protein
LLYNGFQHLCAVFAIFAISVSAQINFSVNLDIVSANIGEETTFVTLITVDSAPFSAPVSASVTSGPNAGAPVTDQGNGVFSYAGANTGTDTVEFTANVLNENVSTSATVTWVDIQCGVQPNPAAEQVGGFVQVTATILRDGILLQGLTVNYTVNAGPNAGVSGSTVTNANGQAILGYTSNGSAGSDSVTISGNISGVPFACPATVNWLDLECNADSNSFAIIDSEYTHTVSIFNDGQPLSGVTVGFSISGVNTGITASVTTDAAGDARFAYSSGADGLDIITAIAIVDGVSTVCSTDVEWTSSGCAVAPSSAARQINTPHTVTISAIAEGSPITGATVNITRSGANGALPPGTTVTTNNDGLATFTYTGTSIGEDILSFLLDSGELCGGIVAWRDLQVSVAPTLATLQAGSTHSLVATVTYNGRPAVGATLDLFVNSGPNASASDSAVADSNGIATISYTSNGNVGRDQIQLQALHAGVGNGTSAAAEWKVGECALTPTDAQVALGSTHAIDIDVTLGAVPQPGLSVEILVTSGPNAGDNASLTTDENGRVRFSYMGDGGPGVDEIQAHSNISGVLISCDTTVEWVAVQCFAIDTIHAAQGGLSRVLVEVTRNGQPAAGVAVGLSPVSGPNASTQPISLTTGPSGGAFTTFSDVADTGGADLLRASGSVDGIPFSCDITVHWAPLGAFSLLPVLLQPTTGSTIAIPTLVVRDGSPAPTTVMFDVVRGPNQNAAVPVPTQGTGLAVWGFSGDGLGLSHVHAGGMIEGAPFSGVAGAHWINGPAAGFEPIFASYGSGNHSVTLTVQDDSEPVEGLIVNVAVIDGPNQGNVQLLTTDGNGQISFTYTSDGRPGIDQILATTVFPSGTASWNALVEWTAIDCSLSAPTYAQIGQPVDIQLDLRREGVAVEDEQVTFDVFGPNNGHTGQLTVTNGQATFRYTGGATTGLDTITASGNLSGIPFSCELQVEWVNIQCDLTPASAVLLVDATQQLTVGVTRNGIPVPGLTVTVEGADEPDPGRATITQTTNQGGFFDIFLTNDTPEQRNVTISGDVDGVAFSCSATVEWADFQLVLTPQSQFHGIGNTATLNASITRNGAAVSGEMIDISVDTGPNAGHSDAAVSPATFTYPGNGGNGTDQVSTSTTVEGVFIEAIAQVGFLELDCQVITPGPLAAVGVENLIQGQVTLNGSPAVGRNVTFLITAGPQAGQTTTTTTNGQGIAEFAITGTATGTDTIELSGDINTVTYSCSKSLDWVTPPTCSVSPGTAIVGVDSSHSVSVTYLANSAIHAEVVSGPNTGDLADLSTDGDGHATFTYTGDGGIGIDTIAFSGHFLGAAVSCQATADWQTIDCQLVGGYFVAGSQAHVTLTLLRNGVAPIPSAVASFAIDQGSNAPLADTLQTDGAGQTTLIYLGQGGIGFDSVLVMGEVDGIHFQCEAPVAWLSGIGCTFSPEHASALSCETETINLAVRNDGNPVEGAVIEIDIGDGPNTGFSTTLTTDAQGHASFELAGTGEVGTDIIIATVKLNNVEETCQATREWTNTAPVISCPDNISCNSINTNGGTVWWPVSATDDCEETPTVTCTPRAGSQFPVGTTVVTCLATDSHGAQGTCTFTVTVTDTIPDELLSGLTKINPEGPVRMDSPLVVDMAHAPYETVEVGAEYEYEYERSVRASLQHFFMGKSPLTVGQFLELANVLFDRRATIPNLRFTDAGDIFYGADIQLFSMSANNNVADKEGRVLFDYGLRLGGNGFFLNAEYVRIKLFGDATLPNNGGNPQIEPSGTECDEMLAVANFPIIGVSWYGSAYLANAYSRYSKGLAPCDLAYAIGLTPEEWRPNHLTVEQWIDGFDPIEQLTWIERFPYAYRLPTYQEFLMAGDSQGAGTSYATHNGGNYFNSDDFFDNGPTPVGYYYPLDHYPINDLSGNVWEWLTEQPSGRAAEMVITGGSWFNSQSFGQIGEIFNAETGGTFSDVGLRFVATHDFRFRAYLREAETQAGPPEEFHGGHVYYPNLLPGTEYVWEAEFTHDNLEGALGWIAEPSIARAEAGFSTTGQQPTSANINAMGGWNLMSVTIEPALCHSKHLFGADSTVWAWNPILQIYEYEPGAVIEPFKGYWVHFPSTVPSQIHGYEPLSTEVTLRPFYNLIGPAQDNFNSDNIENRSGPVYGFVNGAFEEAEALNIGYAYFIFASRASTLELNPAP